MFQNGTELDLKKSYQSTESCNSALTPSRAFCFISNFDGLHFIIISYIEIISCGDDANVVGVLAGTVI